jgi:hypothetical protein
MATSNQKSDYKQSRPPESIPDCEERDNATQKTINTIKKTYCDKLYTSRHAIKKLEITYSGKEKIYKKKEQRFLRTQNNYQRYVNTEINIGSQLVEANKRVGLNVASYKKWDDDLATSLTSAFTAIKDVKTKLNDLRDAAIKLNNSRTDSCSTSQWIILTGKNPDNCKDDQNPPPEPGGDCKNVEETIELLVCMPKALAFDIDSIFKVSSDILGIQKFCNITSLVTLQTELSKKATDFDSLLLSIITTRKNDLEVSRNELIKSLQDRTDAVIDVYNQRCDYDAVYRTVDEICCPRCNCVYVDAGNCEPRLKDCECKICEICGKVRDTFVIAQDNGGQPQPAPANA